MDPVSYTHLDVYKRQDTDGISIYDAMKGYGLDPEKIEDAKWPEGSIGKFLELHIEQGPRCV